jgi:hypothetical protein
MPRKTTLEGTEARIQTAKGRTLPRRDQPRVPSASITAGLKQSYEIEDPPAVAAFVEANGLSGLLLQARHPLRRAFGRATKTLRLVRDDHGCDTLFCLVMVSGEARKARRALRWFDEQWWLARSEQAGGKLNFDFELV